MVSLPLLVGFERTITYDMGEVYLEDISDTTATPNRSSRGREDDTLVDEEIAGY